MNELKQRITDYIQHLSIYDYFALSWVGVFFLFVVMIVFLNIKKRTIKRLKVEILSNDEEV